MVTSNPMTAIKDKLKIEKLSSLFGFPETKKKSGSKEEQRKLCSFENTTHAN